MLKVLGERLGSRGYSSGTSFGEFHIDCFGHGCGGLFR